MEYNWEKPEDVMTALLVLYENQTQDEQQSENTQHRNGVGFNAVDAPILSSFAKQLQRTGYLSEKQYALAKRLLMKYKEQLGVKTNVLSGFTPVKGIYTPAQKQTKNNGTLKIEDEWVFFIPNIYPSNQVKEFGFTWKGNTTGWRAPLSKRAIEGVLRKFSNIVIDPSVDAYLEEVDRPVEVSTTVTDSDLFPFQQEAVKFLLDSRKSMLALAPGLGKTASAIFAGNELDVDRILVICPLTLVRNWKAEIKKWVGKEAVIWRGKVDTWEGYDQWVITNYDTVVRNLQDILNQDFKVVIVDESILVKNRKAKRSDAIKRLGRTTEYLWLLSGSPTSRFLDDAWMQFSILDPKRFSSYWRFVNRYCEVETTQWGTKVSGNQEGAVQKLQNDNDDIYFCRTQDEVLDIPDWIFDTVEVEMSKSQYKVYAQMEEEFLAELQEGEYILAPNVLSQMIRLLQFASNPILLDGVDAGAKWDAVEEMLEYEELPAIIWTQFIKTANLMYERLSKRYRVAVLTGQTKTEDRQDIVDAFQAGKLDIIIAHPAVGKFGLTLTAARTAIYMERSYNGDDYYQSLYRVKRIGTKKSPHIIHLLAVRPQGSDGYTIDHVIDNVLKFRKDMSISITSGMIREYLGKS